MLNESKIQNDEQEWTQPLSRQQLTADWFTGTNRLLAKPMYGYDWLALPVPYLIRDI